MEHTTRPDEYERTSYYNGITGDGDHPELVYRSDFSTTPFPKPVGRYGHIPVKSLRGVFDTPLNAVWDTVGPKIRDLIKARGIHWSSVDPARFFTHAPPGEDGEGDLGPVVIWICVAPGSTSSETAHEVSQAILALLREEGVEDVVVEWREGVLQRLGGSPARAVLRHVGSGDVTHRVRRFLTAFLGVPLASGDREEEGTLTLWFHENEDENGEPSDKVYGVSSCHVLRKHTGVDEEVRGEVRVVDRVYVCGVRRFERGLDEIEETIAGHRVLADLLAREIVRLEADERQDAKEIRASRRKLEDANEAIAELEDFGERVTKEWSDIQLHRDIGHVRYAAPITVDVQGGTGYTSDWAAFEADETKVKDTFEGNVVDLGSKYSPPDLVEMLGGRSTAFKFPEGRKLRIEGCATKEDLANPTQLDRQGQRCLVVGKDGNATDLTVGMFSGLVSFTLDASGTESVELGIYNSGNKCTEVFSAKGDSGALVWHVKHGRALILGQVHSGQNKGGSTSNHVTYCTPGWYLLAQIKKRFKHADFYRTTWST